MWGYSNVLLHSYTNSSLLFNCPFRSDLSLNLTEWLFWSWPAESKLAPINLSVLCTLGLFQRAVLMNSELNPELLSQLSLFSELPTAYYILHAAYCAYYLFHIPQTNGTISMPSVHTAVWRQVTQNVFCTNWQQQQDFLFVCLFFY